MSDTTAEAKYPEFAAKLRSARVRVGKSQETIAAEVGTSRRHWIRWEKGHHLPSAEFMARIGAATGQAEEFTLDPADANGDGDEEADLPSALANLLSELVRREMRRAG